MRSMKRSDIPAQIKREVRKRCGFGCVICGIPLFEYDHIEEYSKVKKHESWNITLLCPNHHKQKTNGLLSKDKVWQATRNPINKKTGVSASYEYWHPEGNAWKLVMGNMEFLFSAMGDRAVFFPVIIDKMPFAKFELLHGDLTLSLELLDEDGQPLLIMKRNQLKIDTASWDYEPAAMRLRLRTGARCVLLDLEFELPSAVKIRRARIMRNGVEFAVLTDFNIVLNNASVLNHISVHDYKYGIVIGDEVGGPTAFYMGQVYRGPFDRTAIIREAKKRMTELRTIKPPYTSI